MIPALLLMLAAAGFESTGCYRRHLNFAAGGGAEAILGNTGTTVDRRPHHRADVWRSSSVAFPIRPRHPPRQARVALVGGAIYPSPTEPPIPD